MPTNSDPKRDLLRHTLATVAYRAAKTTRDAPEHFAGFSIGEGTRTPVEIVAHIGDVLAWADSMARGNETWNVAEPGAWNAEVERLFATLEGFDGYLASDEPLGAPAERLFQGPIADALTHVGQLAMMRRLANAPLRGENYFRADVETGRVGAEQKPPTREFG